MYVGQQQGASETVEGRFYPQRQERAGSQAGNCIGPLNRFDPGLQHQQAPMGILRQQLSQQREGPVQPHEGVGGPKGVPQQQPALDGVPNQLSEEKVDKDRVVKLISELLDPATREPALWELSMIREKVPELAKWLWHSFGTVAALLHEVITVYPAVSHSTLNVQQSKRVCCALVLMQSIASHSETRMKFLEAKIPLYLYPFLHTSCPTEPFEYLRLTALGVFGALVKSDEQLAVPFLLTTEMIPVCLCIMENGIELSKTVATYILQRILIDQTGLDYVCQTTDRFTHVIITLNKVVLQLATNPSGRLLKHVLRCYCRLSDNLQVRVALRQRLPKQFIDGTFEHWQREDPVTRSYVIQLMQNLQSSNMSQPSNSIHPMQQP